MINFKKIKNIFFSNLSLIPVVRAASGFGGQTPSSESITIPNPLKVGSIPELIDRIINYLIVIGGSLVALMVLIGAFQILFAGGDEKRMITGRKTIIYAVVGYAIILISKGIVLIVKEVLGSR